MDSYKRFFVNGNGFPKFKSKHDNNQSCRFPLEGISKVNDYSTNKLTLTSRVKESKFRCSDKYKKYLLKYRNGIKSSTLTKTKSGNYFLSILVDGDLMKINNKPINNIVGIDLGIKDFVVTSENQYSRTLKLKGIIKRN